MSSNCASKFKLKFVTKLVLLLQIILILFVILKAKIITTRKLR